MRPRTWAIWVVVGGGFFYETGLYATCHLNHDLAADTGSHYLPDPQQRVADSQWVRFSVSDQGGDSQGSSHRCRVVGWKGKPVFQDQGTGLRLHMWEGSVISLFSCSFSWISLESSLSCPFVPSLCFYLFPSALTDFLFLASFPHLSTFLASLACSQFFFFYSASLPVSGQNLNWSGKWISAILGLFTSFRDSGQNLPSFVSPFLELTPPLSMAFHWHHVGEWVLTEKFSDQFIPISSKF